MAIVTTNVEQLRAARVAQGVGGYSELLRLAAERQRVGGAVRIQRDETGTFKVVPAAEPQPE